MILCACAILLYTQYIHEYMHSMYITNWRAGASQPSRTTGTIFLYIYMYRRAGAHRPYAHAPNLRETPTRHVYPLPFERMRHYGVVKLSKSGRRFFHVG